MPFAHISRSVLAFTRIFLNDFLETLPPHQEMAAYLSEGYTDSETCVQFQLEPNRLSE